MKTNNYFFFPSSFNRVQFLYIHYRHIHSLWGLCYTEPLFLALLSFLSHTQHSESVWAINPTMLALAASSVLFPVNTDQRAKTSCCCSLLRPCANNEYTTSKLTNVNYLQSRKKKNKIYVMTKCPLHYFNDLLVLSGQFGTKKLGDQNQNMRKTFLIASLRSNCIKFWMYMFGKPK